MTIPAAIVTVGLLSAASTQHRGSRCSRRREAKPVVPLDTREKLAELLRGGDPAGLGQVLAIWRSLTNEPLDLSGTDLTGAELSFADLRNARFDGANLTDALVDEANFEGASFRGGSLEGVVGTDANFSQADLSKTNLKWGELQGGNFTNANLSNSNLHDATLIYGNFTNASFERADMDGTTIIGSNLTGATFSGANLHRAYFEVNFPYDEGFAWFRAAKFAGASYTPKTKWPRGFDPVAAGAVQCPACPRPST